MGISKPSLFRVRDAFILIKGAIITVADAMQKLLDRVIQEGSLTAWGKLLGFCYWGIRRPEGQKSEVVGNVSLATKVKRQVSDLMEEAGLPMPVGGVQVQKGGSTDKDLQRGVSAKFSEGDIKGAVRLLASSRGCGALAGLFKIYHTYIRNFKFRICNGDTAGDPFGPALFSLGVDSIASRVDTEFNVWYLDDGTIGDSPEKVLSCVRVLVDDLRKVGLEVNHSKCELLILNHTREDSLRTEGMFVKSCQDSRLFRGRRLPYWEHISPEKVFPRFCRGRVRIWRGWCPG